MVTIKDVAALAEVSYTTVSHVINNTRPVAAETARRVQEAIDRLGYKPNFCARGLRSGGTKSIGVISSSSDDPYFSQVLHGIQERAWESEYSIYIAYSELSESCPGGCTLDTLDFIFKREADHIQGLENRNIEGLILNSMQPDDDIIKILNDLRMPRILFQRLIPGPLWDNFICDDYQGASDAMRYLLDQGHRRIGLMKGFGYPSHSVHQREKAWHDLLESEGLQIDPELVRDGDYDFTCAYEETRKLLQLVDAPTAILYYSDYMAMAGIRAAADMGLAVPDDVSIIGYDNLGLGDIMIPRLSTVNQQSSLIGRDMMDRLADRIEKPDLKAEVRSYPQNLVIRESSGPVRRG